MRLIVRCEQTREVMKVVPPESWDELPAEPGWFVAEYEYTGCRRYCRLTGRTRRMWGHDYPTVERFDIETYATGDDHALGAGVVMARVGDRLPGMWATPPQNVTEGEMLP